MKTFGRIMLAAVTALAITSPPMQASRQEQEQARSVPTPCPTPIPEPIIYPMSTSLRPKITRKESAAYTHKAREAKIQGSVVLQVLFHESGKVTEIRAIRGLSHGLTEQAIGTAHMIRFNPAMKDGKPVSVQGILVFDFQLH